VTYARTSLLASAVATVEELERANALNRWRGYLAVQPTLGKFWWQVSGVCRGLLLPLTFTFGGLFQLPGGLDIASCHLSPALRLSNGAEGERARKRIPNSPYLPVEWSFRKRLVLVGGLVTTTKTDCAL
jgi:hypothetical protein